MVVGRRRTGVGNRGRVRAVSGRWLGLPMLIFLPMLVAGCASDGGGGGEAAAGGDALPAVNVQSSQLMGLDPGQVTGLLGPADFRRDDGPAQILQYRSPTCVLDLFLYRDSGGGDFHVTYIEARDRSLSQQAPQTCLASVVRSKRVGHASS